MTAEKNEAGNSLPMEFKFNSANQAIRIEMVHNQPFFVAIDVCDVLGLTNVTKAIYALDDDERLTLPIVRAGQTREVNLISESGLYNLIFRSNKPEAKSFRKWVTQEVLPAIRKKGTYEVKKALAIEGAPRRHNRLTQERIVGILADVAKIENTELRLQLVNKIMGGPAK